jgi:hypothetical protein
MREVDSMSSRSAPSAAAPASELFELDQLVERSVTTMTSLQTMQRRVASKSAVRAARSAAPAQAPAGGGLGAESDDDSEDDEDEAFENEMSVLQQQAGGIDIADSAVGGSEWESLLAQLEVEPDSDAERAAKFAVYEKYAETVADSRQAFMAFWAGAKDSFPGADGGGGGPGAAAREIQREVDGIDSEQNMGLQDAFGFGEGGGRWFVHGMAQQAARNAALLERVLAQIKTKLELLDRQCECPVCLEPLRGVGGGGAAATATITTGGKKSDGEGDAGGGGGSGEGEGGLPFTTLSCCHKVCVECWAGWSRMQSQLQQPAFCPLCRHRQFLERIMTTAE